MKQIKELSERLFDLRGLLSHLNMSETQGEKTSVCSFPCKIGNIKADMNIPIPYLKELANNEIKETKDALNVLLEESKESDDLHILIMKRSWIA